MALPMPRSENEMYMSHSWLSLVGMKLSKSGRNTARVVTTSERSTVRLRPILFISIPVGTENMRNQKNTSDGKKLAAESESPKSSCMLFDTEPTRSTNPIVKNVIITGTMASLLELLLFISFVLFSLIMSSVVLISDHIRRISPCLSPSVGGKVWWGIPG